MLNVCIAYELYNCSSNHRYSFTLKICTFGTVKLIKNAIKSKFIYNDRGIAFNGAGD